MPALWRASPYSATNRANAISAIPNVWFCENTEGGHGAAADHKQEAFMRALVYDFLWDQLQ